MSENDVRDGLREAVAGEPPLDFDPDALVDTARRQVRRRALVSVGVATVAVVAAAVAVPLALSGGDGGGVPVADRPTATSQAEPESPPIAPEEFEWPPAGMEPVSYTAAELQQRANEMRASLLEVLPTVLPEATDITVGLFSGEAEGMVSDDQNYLNAFATFTVEGARYGIAVNVYAPGMYDQSPAQLCESATCIQRGAADGGYLMTTSEDMGEGLIVSAYHYRDSGGAVFVSGYNYDPTSHTAPVYHPSLPVGAELLGRLATDSRFDLYGFGVIEDRLRAVRFDEPRLDLDVDELVARAGRRRAILGAVAASCAVVVAMMAIGLVLGARQEARPMTVAARTTPPTTPTPPPTTVGDCFGRTPVKVVATHVPKARLEQLTGCPTLVYRVAGTSELLTFDRDAPADGYVLTDDLAGPRDGRLLVYEGPAKGDLAVLLVASDGTMMSVSTTGGILDLDTLIALVTDPALLR